MQAIDSGRGNRGTGGIRRHVTRGAVVLAVAVAVVARAFPPAPHHTVTGMVRDQLGNPFQDQTATIVLDTGGTNTVSTAVSPGLAPGENYRFQIAMDSGITGDLYKPTALLPAAPFRLLLRVGNTTYVPMEMKGNLGTLGQPGGITHLDLTLGTSSNNDGLPDAWKQAVIQHLGLPLKPAQIHPGDLYPGTGLTYYQVYLAGTYFLSPKDGFALSIAALTPTAAELEFTAVKGRTYTVMGATELGSWIAVQFTVKSSASAAVSTYLAPLTQKLRVEVPLDADGAPCRFYRLMVE